MRYNRMFACLLAVMFFSSVGGQTRLSDSQKVSRDTFIYKIDRKEARSVYLKGDVDESMLHTFVASYSDLDSMPVLERGNYLKVQALRNKLKYSGLTVDNFCFGVVQSGDVMLHLYDTLGRVIDDAHVTRGLKKLRFDERTQTYNISRVGDGKMIEVDNKGVYHYIEMERNGYYDSHFFRELGWNARRYWHKATSVFYSGNNSSKGFIALSKPKYKPGETVRLKAYVANNNGKPYNGSAKIMLAKNYLSEADTLLATIRPYRPGMYEYSFRLSDSLKMQLDNDYIIYMKGVSERFRYEEYQLDEVSFTAKASKNKSFPGDTVRLTLNARDQNDMPVYDGRVTLAVVPRYRTTYLTDKAFMPDTLWQYTTQMEGAKPTEVILPDSIFPRGVSFDYSVWCVFLNSENEKQTKNISLERDGHEKTIDILADKGVMSVRRIDNGKSVDTPARITEHGSNGEVIGVDSVMLPCRVVMPWYVSYYVVEADGDKQEYLVDYHTGQPFDYDLFREGDKVRFVVNNPAGAPFWYQVMHDKRVIEKGYTTSLDYSCKERDKGAYSVQLSWLFGDESQSSFGKLPFAQKNISLEVTAPLTVYPGQTTTIDLSVADKNGRPMKDADITAWGITSKFGNGMPYVSIPGKTKSSKSANMRVYSGDKEDALFLTRRMTWDRWRERMGLDTMEYYKFIHPAPLYAYSEPDRGKVTQVAPYVTINGDIQDVEIIWIDDQPHFFAQAEQLGVYSFPVTPGKHTLRLRLPDREVTLRDAVAVEGMKTIFSIDGSDNAQNITVTKYGRKLNRTLSDNEVAALSRYMITVNTYLSKLQLPGMEAIRRPQIVNSGGVPYLINDKLENYEYSPRKQRGEPLLIGPFPNRSVGGMASLYADTMFVRNFQIEGGYNYTFTRGDVVLKKWGNTPFKTHIGYSNLSDNDLPRHAPTLESIGRQFRERIAKEMSKNSAWIDYASLPDEIGCKLELAVEEKDAKPVMILFTPEQGAGQYWYLYMGGRRNFTMPAGKIKATLIFADTTSCSREIVLLPAGRNYLRIDPSVRTLPDSLSRAAFATLASQTERLNSEVKADTSLVSTFSSKNQANGVITGLVMSKRGELLAGATILIDGTARSVSTDVSGRFVIWYGDIDLEGKKLVVSRYGYHERKIDLKPGYDYRIYLSSPARAMEDSTVVEEMTKMEEMDEMMVIAYGTSSKRDLTGSVTRFAPPVVMELSGMIPGIRVADAYEDGEIIIEKSPIIIVDGVPYSGKLEDLPASEIASMEVLKDASATAIYGSRAADGVIVINTRGGNFMATQPDEQGAGQSMRRNFHDDAFWQPRITTGRDGKARFDVTWPDDITSWNANFVAVAGRNKVDKKEVTVNSFKSLTAQLSLPQFAVRGDSLNAVGKVVSHLPDTIQARTTSAVDGVESSHDISVVSSYTEYIPVNVAGGDSVTVSYSILRDNGYFDGEERKVPVYESGTLQTKGEFAVIGDGEEHVFATDPDLDVATIHAEASAMELFLREISRINDYPYFCNEQTASKIKALIAEKHICAAAGIRFKEDAKINSLIARLNRNRNDEGLWGWWNRDKTEFWIARQVIEAMVAAEKEGYKTGIDKRKLADLLLSDLNSWLSASGMDKKPEKTELLERMLLLNDLGAQIDYAAYYTQIDQLINTSLHDKLSAMYALSATGLTDRINKDTLMAYAGRTMMGALYWPETISRERRQTALRVNDVENTLLAYRTLRNMGGNQKELEQIRNYLFEQRKGGQWRNTYESSRIVETIMPDMISDGEKFEKVSAVVAGKQVDKFPYTAQIEAGEQVSVKKNGTEPLFFTVYQQSWNPDPKAANEGFTVSSQFKSAGSAVAVLRAGETVDLEVIVNASSDADYVMVEIPIPAGCGYESKERGDWRVEAHREYFKEKVSIFCNSLPRGEHRFTVKLTPRYTGTYHLNPARAELMYFPTFYGRNQMTNIEITNTDEKR